MDYEEPDPYEEYDSEEERERMLELEAELYSKLHYASEIPELDNQPEMFPENVPDDFPNDVPEGQPAIYEVLEARITSSEKPEDDSGHCSIKSDEVSECSSTLKESKYEAKVKQVADDSADSSSDDEGIQLICDIKKQPKKPMTVVTIESGSDSEVELVGTVFRRSVLPEITKKTAPSIKLSVKPRPKVSLIEEKSPKKTITLQASSSSYSDSSAIESDNEIQSSISLNLVGKASTGKRLIRFAEIIEKEVPVVEQARVPKWTEDMHNFYNEIDFSKVDLTVDDVLKDLPKDPKKWKIDPEDRYKAGNSPSTGRPRYFQRRSGGSRCRNCNRFGHYARECPEPERAIICHMCGTEGHEKDTCPNSMCLRCGEPDTHFSNNGCSNCRKFRNAICFTCGGRGHLKQDCPNNWRKYHVTTSGTIPVVPKDEGRTAEESWCPNCAKKGHYVHQCRAYFYSQYPPSVPYVVNYDHDSETAVMDEEESSNREKKCKKRKIREIKAKRREFLGFSSTPKNENPAKKRKMSGGYSTPATKYAHEVDRRLDKASKALEDLLADQERLELNSSSKRWRKRKKVAEKFRKEEVLPKRRNNKKKDTRSVKKNAPKKGLDTEVGFLRGNFIPLRAKRGTRFDNIKKAQKLRRFRGQESSNKFNNKRRTV